MARVVFYAMGVRGDVLPYVAIAAGMAARGHDVRFVTPREFHPIVETSGVRGVHSGTDFGPSTLDQHGAYVARWGNRLGGVMLPRLYFDKLTVPFIDTLYEAIDAELATADVVISHTWPHLISGPAAERRGVTSIVGDLFAMLVPSRSTRPPGMPALGAIANRLGWAAASSPRLGRYASLGAFRRFRERLGLNVDGWNLPDARLSTPLTLGLFSSHYQPKLPDWPDGYAVTGFTPWSPATGGLPADVERFVAAGDAPIVVTLGTSAASANPGLFVKIAAALDSAGRRGAFLASNDELATTTRHAIGTHHGVWPFVPLVPLLRHAAGVVHA